MIHGRRQGRPLTAAQRRLLKRLLPKVSLSLPGNGEKLDATAIFPASMPELWLEIGFGGGEHLAVQARRQAEIDGPAGIIGVDFFLTGIAKLLRALEGTSALERVRLYQGDVVDLLAALPKASLDRVFILFPDPWPKRRHNKRRLIRRGFLDELAGLMKSGGELRMATDDREYLEWMLERLTGHPAFFWLATRPADWRLRKDDWPPTRFEEKAAARSRKSTYLRFRRRPRDNGETVDRRQKTLAGDHADA